MNILNTIVSFLVVIHVFHTSQPAFIQATTTISQYQASNTVVIPSIKETVKVQTKTVYVPVVKTVVVQATTTATTVLVATTTPVVPDFILKAKKQILDNQITSNTEQAIKNNNNNLQTQIKSLIDQDVTLQDLINISGNASTTMSSFQAQIQLKTNQALIIQLQNEIK